MRLGWRPPLHIGALAELGEEHVALQGVWQDIDPSRFQRGLMNIFPFPFRQAGSSGRDHNDEAPGEHDQDLPEQHEQSPDQTLSQPGQERFDVFTKLDKVVIKKKQHVDHKGARNKKLHMEL